MHQLSPQETFPIVYVLADPSDTATYYVRSVVRNSVSGAIIKINGQNFVNLVDNGNQRFIKNIQAPTDSSGLGLYIDITTQVYTDAGYTTLSPNYFKQLDNYLVQQRWQTGLGGGGGWGYEQLKKLIEDVLIEKIKPVEPTDLSPVYEMFDQYFADMMNQIALYNKETTPQQPVDLSPILALLEKCLTEINNNRPEKINLSEIIDLLNEIKTKEPTPFPKIPDPMMLLQHLDSIKVGLRRLENAPKSIVDEQVDQISDESIDTRVGAILGYKVKADTNSRIKRLIT